MPSTDTGIKIGEYGENGQTWVFEIPFSENHVHKHWIETTLCGRVKDFLMTQMISSQCQIQKSTFTVVEQPLRIRHISTE